jgi:hypothetical protein
VTPGADLPSEGDDGPMPASFGVSAATGMPLPPVDDPSLRARFQAESGPDPVRDVLEERITTGVSAKALASFLGDPGNLEIAHWGLVLGRGTPPAVKAALQKLIDHRRAEAGGAVKIFEGNDAPAPGERVSDWLARHGTALNVVDPALGVPYYLLLVGSPDEITFEFQYTLDIFWAVGRLHFEEADSYARYAQGVVDHETAAAAHTLRRIALFATEHDFDAATQLFAGRAARPMADEAAPHGPIGRLSKYALATWIGATARRQALLDILRGQALGGLPALLFTGSHGLEAADDAHRAATQGALVCQDWPGYGHIAREHWFEAADLPADASLLGLVHLFFACHSAGYPAFDTYARQAGSPRRIAAAAAVARLPQAMLSHPAGPALASIGHIDRAWPHSFQGPRGVAQLQVFRALVAQLARGDRVGHATDPLNLRWAALSTELSDALAARRQDPQALPAALLARRWTARDDARNYVVLGDPAVRLRPECMPEPPPGSRPG